MAKKSKILLLIFIIIITLFMIKWFLIRDENASFAEQFSFNEDDLYADKNRVLMDSIVINDSVNLYYFNYSAGVFGTSIGFLSIEKNKESINKDNAFLQSAFIYNFKYQDSTLLLKLSKKKYVILKKNFPFQLKIEMYNEKETMLPGKELFLHLDK